MCGNYGTIPLNLITESLLSYFKHNFIGLPVEVARNAKYINPQLFSRKFKNSIFNSLLQWTWDTMRNTNKQMSGTYKPRCRFDRVYFRPATSKAAQWVAIPKFFGLIGLQKIASYQCFPSGTFLFPIKIISYFIISLIIIIDHWGLLMDFDTKSSSN